MQRLRFALRIGLLITVTALTLVSLGSLPLAARDAFDADYTDCKAEQRFRDVIRDLRVTRTGDDDKVKVSWKPLDPDSLNLGSLAYLTRIAVILEPESGDSVTEKAILGETDVEFTDISLAQEYEVSAALVVEPVSGGDYVISDITVIEFTSGLAAPKFFSPFYVAKSDADDIFRNDLDEAYDENDNPRALANLFNSSGEAITDRASVRKHGDATSTFYYLGFNHGFENWYTDPKDRTSANQRYPRTPKFRIGLRHGSDDPDDNPSEADFDHFRIRISDSSNDDVLGFDAGTVVDRIYSERVLVLGNVQDESTAAAWVIDEANAPYFANIKRSNRVDDPVDAYYASSAAFWTRYTTGTNVAFPQGAQVRARRAVLSSENDANTNLDPHTRLDFRLSSNNLLGMELIGGGIANQRQMFALPPVEIYDMDPDEIGQDSNYTFKAWAEDEDGNQISSTASITLSLREQFKDEAWSNLATFRPTGVRSNVYTDIGGFIESDAVVLGLSIFDD